MDLTCPHCGAANDRYSDPKRPDATPKDGDISICVDCGECSIFDLHKQCLRLPSIDEQHELDSNSKLMLYRATLRHVKRKHTH